MKTLKALGVVVFIGVLLLLLSEKTYKVQAPSFSYDASAWYPVVRVVDGDTIVVKVDGLPTAIRFIGVDTPETVDPREPVQCFGKEASERTQQILDGTSVRLELDPSQGSFDTYGRVLAYVFAPANSKMEGILVNEILIAEGYGHEYTYNLPYKYQAQFKTAENLARSTKKGLWAEGVCD